MMDRKDSYIVGMDCKGAPRGRQPPLMSDHQLTETSPSLERFHLGMDSRDPYVNLANAIVCVAADDYRDALRCNDVEALDDVEEFFYSDWFKVLSKVNPDELIQYLHSELDHEISAPYFT